jgi:hypothetical protein
MHASSVSNAGRWEIVVCDRGFVLAGFVRPGPDPLTVEVDRCQCVRRWRTQKGLGQLALEGPQTETILDPEGDGVLVSLLHVLRRIPVSEAGTALWIQRTS